MFWTTTVASVTLLLISIKCNGQFVIPLTSKKL